jgi:hypothetical protein
MSSQGDVFIKIQGIFRKYQLLFLRNLVQLRDCEGVFADMPPLFLNAKTPGLSLAKTPRPVGFGSDSGCMQFHALLQKVYYQGVPIGNWNALVWEASWVFDHFAPSG